MEGGDRQIPELKIKVEHNHPVQVGEEGVVEGGHVEQVELEGGGLPDGDHGVLGPRGEVELPPHITRLQLQQLVLRPGAAVVRR